MALLNREGMLGSRKVTGRGGASVVMGHFVHTELIRGCDGRRVEFRQF